jgi:predicted hotdog family 3-hydroxylacyl-ACP dehydratase
MLKACFSMFFRSKSRIAMAIEIQSLVPHRGPMLLISEIVSLDARSASTRSVVADHWPLVGRQGANAMVLVELVAQTAAVNNGWDRLQREGPAASRLGWIVGIKSARFQLDVVPLGTIVLVESFNQLEYDDFRVIHGTAVIDGTVAAEVTLQLMKAQSGSPA